jgi:hypothetical protein
MNHFGVASLQVGVILALGRTDRELPRWPCHRGGCDHPGSIEGRFEEHVGNLERVG